MNLRIFIFNKWISDHIQEVFNLYTNRYRTNRFNYIKKMDFQFMVKNTCKNMVISFSFLIEYAIFFRVGYLHAFCHPILNEI